MTRSVTVILILALAAAAGFAVLFFESSRSTMAFEPQPKAVGAATPVAVRIDNPHGARHVRVVLEQNGASTTLLEQSQPSRRLTFWRSRHAPEEIRFTAGAKQVPGLKEGKARIVVEAESNDLRGAED